MTHFEPIDLLTTDYRLQRQGLRHESSGPVPGTAGCCFYHKESLKEIVPRVSQQKQMSSLRELRRPAASGVSVSTSLHERGVSASRHVRHFYQNANNINVKRVCSQMTSAFLGVSDTPWCLCQPIISFWHAPWCFKLTTSFVNSPEPKTIILEFSLFPSEASKYVLQNGSS